MKLDIKQEFKTWGVYFGMIFLAVFAHELGHSISAWIHGYRSFPTPAKEYSLETIPLSIQPYVSLGGIIGSALFTAGLLLLYVTRTFKFNSAILAAAIANPGMYTIRFMLKGRGHDATEFQEAQSALGLSYSGHFLDWLFLTLFILGVVVWYIKSKPGYRIMGRLILGFILTFIFLVELQNLNNAIFDPILQGE